VSEITNKQWIVSFYHLVARRFGEFVHWLVGRVDQYPPSPLEVTQALFLCDWRNAQSTHERGEQRFGDPAFRIVKISARRWR